MVASKRLGRVVSLAAALVVSTFLTLTVTVWVFVGVSRLMERKG